MPTVREQFKTYRDFASASLTDIYGDRLDTAYKLSVNQLESGVWINQTQKEGEIKFTWQKLPWEAQLSPVNAIVSGDFDGDGKLEIILAQNHTTNWPETGPWRGNPGCHLEWSGQQFKVIPHIKSGIVLPKDTKSLLSLDIDNDGKLDIIGGQNNDKLLIFKNIR
jgi:hypothetical protein